MADMAWQRFLGLSTPRLPFRYRSEHFTHEELNSLLNSWGGGNVLEQPEHIALFAEHMYKFNSKQEMYSDPGTQGMWRDGLGRVIAAAEALVAAKKNW